MRADEKLTAFMGLQRAVHEFAVSLIRSPRNVVETHQHTGDFKRVVKG